VTLTIVWDEYIAAHPGGYRYSRFCELYQAFADRLPVTMRQSHAAGEKLFVDYAGDGVPVVIDRLTGELRNAQIFVAVLGASNFTFAVASWTQGLADFVDAHVRAFQTIGGVPALLVPDNTKAAVIKACLYDPQINRTYADMAAHYGTAILPARPRRPRDKVEQAVLMVERWLLGRMRHRIFYSLAEVNAEIGELLQRLNEERPIRRLGVRRRQLLEQIDRSALKGLPADPYVLAEWRIRRVGIDYHIEAGDHYYSVPHRFARAEVEVRFTVRTVEISSGANASPRKRSALLRASLWHDAKLGHSIRYVGVEGLSIREVRCCTLRISSFQLGNTSPVKGVGQFGHNSQGFIVILNRSGILAESQISITTRVENLRVVWTQCKRRVAISNTLAREV
jgi:transposase